MDKSPQIAKLTAPSLGKVYHRTRLYKEIDLARKEKQALWLSAPGGSGKTTLIAAYARRKKLSTVWYKIDEGDEDLAAFFHYLSQTVTATADIPLFNLTPEYLAGINIFVRNFFRNFSQLIPRSCLLVLDNYQNLVPDALLHSVMSIAIEELPSDVFPVFVSRTNPSAHYSRLIANQSMYQIDKDKLNLSRVELKAIAEFFGRKHIPEDDLDNIMEFTNGWMLGIGFLLKQSDLNLYFKTGNMHEGDILFQYFFTEMFQSQKKEIQEFLLSMRFVHQFTLAQACRLAKTTNVREVINELVEKNAFISSRQNGSEYYEFHPLFAYFLESLSGGVGEDKTSLYLRSAEILAEQLNIGAAIKLYKQMQEWESIAKIIISNAQNLVANGRFRTLQDWLSFLPENYCEQIPWLQFWQAMSLMPLDISRARAMFDMAYQNAKRLSDPVVMIVAWSGYVETFSFFMSHFNGIDKHVDEIKVLLEGMGDSEVDPMIQARIANGMFNAYYWKRGDYKDTYYWALQAEQALVLDIDPGFRVMIGNSLLLYYATWLGDFDKARAMMERVDMIANEVSDNPLVYIMWCVMKAHLLAQKGEFVQCDRTVLDGEVVSQRSGVLVANAILFAQGVYGALNEGDVEKARFYLNKISEFVYPNDAVSNAHMYFLKSWTDVVDRHLDDVPKNMTLMEDYACATKSSLPIAWSNMMRAHYFLIQAEYSNARHVLEDLLIWAERTNSANMFYHCFLSLALIEMREGREVEAKGYLSRAFEIGKNHNYIINHWIGWCRDLMSELCQLALDYHIEVDHVRKIIQTRRLLPVEGKNTSENWPYPLRIYTMGRFSIVIHDKPLDIKGKAQHKLLELLKVIISLGGRGVSIEEIADLVWPDSEGDSAVSAFHTNLSRLRKMLGDDNYISLHNRRISLDERFVWTDIWSIQRSLGDVTRALDNIREGKDIKRYVQYLLAYQGDFLEGENSGWVIALRERVHYKWLSCVRKVGKCLLEESDWQELCELFQTAFDIDPLSEDVCQILMESYYHLGRQSDVRRVYNHCKLQLANVFQIEPSKQTQSCFEKFTLN